MANNRKPAHLEYVGGKSKRQQIWEKIRSYNGRPFTLQKLKGDLPGTIHADTTRSYIKALIAGGFVGTCNGTQLTLKCDNGVEAPRVRKDGTLVTQGRAQENMWRTLRSITHPVNAVELAAMASTSEHPVNPEAARDYLANLMKAGYLDDNFGDAKYRRRKPKYRLLQRMNTGPRPPMVQRISQIYDPNLGKVVWSQGDDDDE